MSWLRKICHFGIVLFGIRLLFVVIARNPYEFERLHERFESAITSQPSKIRTVLQSLRVAKTTSTPTSVSKPSIHDSTMTTTHRPICKGGPKRQLLFMKTHKTGSCTVQNILMRYAWANDLIVGLPIRGNIFGYLKEKRFSKELIEPIPPGRQVDMLIHHMMFDYEGVSSVLPSNSVYFTILRDPATQFESVHKYFGTSVLSFIAANKAGGLEEFVSHPERYFKGREERGFWWFAKNSIFYDLGFDNLNEIDAYVEETIAKMDDIFDFVIITEYFDISLLILREILCWDMKDLVYLTVNARKQSTVKNMTAELGEKIRHWNKADTALYVHYNKTLWRRVKEYGSERLDRDLKIFQKLKETTAGFCFETTPVSGKDVHNSKFKVPVPPGTDIVQFQLKEEAKRNDTCEQLMLPEFQWLSKLKKRQRELIAKKRIA